MGDMDSVATKVTAAFDALAASGFETQAGDHATTQDAYKARDSRNRRSGKPFLGFSEDDLPDPDATTMSLFHDLPTDDTKSAAVSALVDQGLTVDWDGSPDLRITVTLA